MNNSNKRETLSFYYDEKTGDSIVISTNLNDTLELTNTKEGYSFFQDKNQGKILADSLFIQIKRLEMPIDKFILLKEENCRFRFSH